MIWGYHYFRKHPCNDRRAPTLYHPKLCDRELLRCGMLSSVLVCCVLLGLYYKAVQETVMLTKGGHKVVNIYTYRDVWTVWIDLGYEDLLIFWSRCLIEVKLCSLLCQSFIWITRKNVGKEISTICLIWKYDYNTYTWHLYIFTPYR